MLWEDAHHYVMETLPASVNPALDRFPCAKGGVAKVLFKMGCPLLPIQVETDYCGSIKIKYKSRL